MMTADSLSKLIDTNTETTVCTKLFEATCNTFTDTDSL